MCAMKVLKENGLVPSESPKLPDHSPVEDVNALVAEMNNLSL